VAKEMGRSSTQVTFKNSYRWLPEESLSDTDAVDSMIHDALQPSST